MFRFEKILVNGMREHGHDVQLWFPEATVFRLPAPQIFKKWFGYIDQYILFPAQVRRRLKGCSPDTLFVFTDHALGPWVPLIGNRPHVIHCHDFLAQLSSMDEILENRLGWTGKLYQRMIRNGFNKGKYFISVSQKTKQHLHLFLKTVPKISEVVYNGLSRSFRPYPAIEARDLLSERTNSLLQKGYLLHVGGNQWYKNRIGLVHLYNVWRSTYRTNLPLLLIGELPDTNLMHEINSSPFKSSIHPIGNIIDKELNLAYSGASVCIFPSLAEGFGWPIAEAMASGCPVITTDKMPMKEVAGDAGFFIPNYPSNKLDRLTWATDAARVLNRVISFTPEEREKCIQAGFANARRFDAKDIIEKIETIYLNILKEQVYHKQIVKK